METLAAVLRECGRSRPFAGSRPFTFEEVKLDEPADGEALVRVAAAGLCHSDLSVVDGSRPRPMPMVLGHEASGVVEAVGPSVRGLSAGDPVVFSFVPRCRECARCAEGRPALCERGARSNLAGTLLSGAIRIRDRSGGRVHHHLGVSGFARHALVDASSLVRLDREVPLDLAPLFGCAVLTGVGAVLRTARVERGASVAIFGLGGVGLSAVMGAAAAGANPIVAVDPFAWKCALAQSLGATHTVVSGDQDPVEAVRGIVLGGVDYAFEGAGSEVALVAAFASTRRGGTTVTMGLPAPDRKFSVPAITLTAEERTVKGSFMGSAVPDRDIPEFIALWRSGKLPVEKLLTRFIALEELNEGFDALAEGRAARQIVRMG